MPSRRVSSGEYRDIAHPINTETRQMLEEQILLAYKEELQKALSVVDTSDYNIE